MQLTFCAADCEVERLRSRLPVPLSGVGDCRLVEELLQFGFIACKGLYEQGQLMIPSLGKRTTRTATECLEELVRSDGFLRRSCACKWHQYTPSTVSEREVDLPRSLVRRAGSAVAAGAAAPGAGMAPEGIALAGRLQFQRYRRSSTILCERSGSR